MNILIQIAAYHSLTTITLLFTLGIAVGYRMPLAVSSQERVLLTLSLFFTIAFFLCWKKPFSAAIRLLILIPSSFLLGVIHISAAVQLPAEKEHLYHRFAAKKEATIVGFMRNMPRSFLQKQQERFCSALKENGRSKYCRETALLFVPLSNVRKATRHPVPLIIPAILPKKGSCSPDLSGHHSLSGKQQHHLKNS